ncbi:MAG: EamA family transporter [Thermoanaerobaculia bacterium]
MSLRELVSTSRGRVIPAFAAIYLIWGSTYLAIRLAIDTMPPFLMAGTRYLIAGAILYPLARKQAGRPEKAHWIGAGIIGAFLLLGGNGGVVWAEQRVASGLAALPVATVPLWTVLLDSLIRRRWPTRRVLAGLFMGFLGLVLLVGPGELAGSNRVDPIGVAALVAGALCWATGTVLSRRVKLPASPLLGTAMEMLVGGALLFAFGLLFGEGSRLRLDAITPKSIAALAYLVVFGSLIGLSAYVWLLTVVAPARVSTYAFVNPVIAVLLGWAFHGEPLTARTLIAAGVIVGAVVLITTERMAKEPICANRDTEVDRGGPEPAPGEPSALSNRESADVLKRIHSARA